MQIVRIIAGSYPAAPFYTVYSKSNAIFTTPPGHTRPGGDGPRYSVVDSCSVFPLPVSLGTGGRVGVV